MSLFSIPGVYENERPCLALWSIGHGPNSSDTWIVFQNAHGDNYEVRRGYRFHGPWKISQTKLPAATRPVMRIIEFGNSAAARLRGSSALPPGKRAEH